MPVPLFHGRQDFQDLLTFGSYFYKMDMELKGGDQSLMEPKPNNQLCKQKTQELLELWGTWEDDRSANEIIKEIYDSRTSSQKEVNL